MNAQRQLPWRNELLNDLALIFAISYGGRMSGCEVTAFEVLECIANKMKCFRLFMSKNK